MQVIHTAHHGTLRSPTLVIQQGIFYETYTYVQTYIHTATSTAFPVLLYTSALFYLYICKDQHIILIADSAYGYTKRRRREDCGTLSYGAVWIRHSSEIQTEQKVSVAVFRAHNIQSDDHDTGFSPVIF